MNNLHVDISFKMLFFTNYIGVLPNKNMSIILAMAKECNVPDEVAEWLRRWTANPLCSARVGSNPILVAIFFSVTG